MRENLVGYRIFGQEYLIKSDLVHSVEVIIKVQSWLLSLVDLKFNENLNDSVFKIFY